MTADQRKSLYETLNQFDDARQRRLAADSVGCHEPHSLYGGLYATEEIDDDFVEPTEARTGFIPVEALTEREGNCAPLKRKKDAKPSRPRPLHVTFIPCVFRRVGDRREPIAGFIANVYPR